MGVLSIDVTGIVYKIGEVQEFGSGFKKTQLLLNVDDGKYTQCLNLEFVGDRHDLPQSVEVGQEVSVTFDVRGREYKDTAFNSLQAWKMVATGSQQHPEAAPPRPTEKVEQPEEFEQDIPL